ncbi:MAG: OadG family protein [Anaerolineae bacterium]|nr:OadG family protein [Anaerolineae bacterium]
MSTNTLDLLGQGLMITVIGMSLVFGALALLWGIMRLLSLVFREKEEDASPQVPEAPAAAADFSPEAELLTAERAHVAAIVAGALLSNALPLLFEPPPGPTFEHGRSAPSWVVGNRSHALQRWHPPRKPESYPTPSNEY